MIAKINRTSLVLVLVAGALNAGVPIESNLDVVNPDFAMSDMPWETNVGTCVFDNMDGSDLAGGSGPGSYSCMADINDQAAFGQCIPITSLPAGTELLVTFSFRGVAAAGLPGAAVIAFASNDCSDAFGRFITVGGPFGTPNGNWESLTITSSPLNGEDSIFAGASFANFGALSAGIMSFDDISILARSNDLILRSTFSSSDVPAQ